jgi:hypothetical protein
MTRLVSLLLLVLTVLLAPRITRAAEEPVNTLDEAARAPHVLRIGVEVAGLSKLEVGPGSYNAELFVTIRCDAEPCNADLDVTNGKVVGKEKLLDLPLEKALKIKAELTDFFDLSEFPFDSHVLHVSLADKSDPLHARLEVDRSTSGIARDVRIAGWHVDGWTGDVESRKVGRTEQVQELNFGVAIRRPRASAFMKTLLPVFFMVFIAGFTLLLKPKSAAGRLTAATAGLLSVVMFHVSAASSLPPLGYLTRMDKLMIGTYVVYLVNIAFTVAMVRFEEKKQDKWAELSYLASAGAVPGLALCIWVAVFMRIV